MNLQGTTRPRPPHRFIGPRPPIRQYISLSPRPATIAVIPPQIFKGGRDAVPCVIVVLIVVGHGKTPNVSTVDGDEVGPRTIFVASTNVVVEI